MTAVLSLPMPPSVNALYANRRSGGRQKSKKYLAWIAEAAPLLMIQRPGRITGDIAVEYTFGPRCKKSDVFNREKALSDLLVSHGVIEDDRKIVRGVVQWSDDVSGAEIRIEPLQGDLLG